MLLQVGQPLLLNLQLFDGDATKYVRAYLRDSGGTALSGSPVNLTNIGAGLYSNNSILMPDTEHVTAVYKVFSDSGYTTPSAAHSDSLDVFNRAQGVSECLELSASMELDQEITAIIEDC